MNEQQVEIGSNFPMHTIVPTAWPSSLKIHRHWGCDVPTISYRHIPYHGAIWENTAQMLKLQNSLVDIVLLLYGPVTILSLVGTKYTKLIANILLCLSSFDKVATGCLPIVAWSITLFYFYNNWQNFILSSTVIIQHRESSKKILFFRNTVR